MSCVTKPIALLYVYEDIFLSFIGIIRIIIVLNSTAACCCLRLSNKNFDDVCKETQKEHPYILDGLISGWAYIRNNIFVTKYTGLYLVFYGIGLQIKC